MEQKPIFVPTLYIKEDDFRALVAKKPAKEITLKVCTSAAEAPWGAIAYFPISPELAMALLQEQAQT